MSTQPQGKFVLMAGVAMFVAVIGFYVLNAPDENNGVQTINMANQ
jgi:hypothetical protein